jgi:hypothetical protein
MVILKTPEFSREKPALAIIGCRVRRKTFPFIFRSFRLRTCFILSVWISGSLASEAAQNEIALFNSQPHRAFLQVPRLVSCFGPDEHHALQNSVASGHFFTPTGWCHSFNPHFVAKDASKNAAVKEGLFSHSRTNGMC